MRWVVNATPRPLYSRERPGTHCIGGWVDPRAGLEGCRKSRMPPGFVLRTVQPVEIRYTSCAIPAHTTSWGVSVNWLQTSVLWDVTPCSLGYKYWWFGYADITCWVEGLLVLRCPTAVRYITECRVWYLKAMRISDTLNSILGFIFTSRQHPSWLILNVMLYFTFMDPCIVNKCQLLSNKMRLCAVYYISVNYSTCFG
jgi:hypothetical protein